MEQTLVLNATFAPIKVVDWQRAVTLLFQGKVEVVEEYDREIRSVSFTFKLPSVVRLLRFVKLKRRPQVQFTRANIYARDEYTCQFCGEQFSTEDLTFDHVIPQAQGGRRCWENIVAACVSCNRRKADRTPEQAGMALLRKPHRPAILAPSAKLTIGLRSMPDSWRSWIYWNIELDHEKS